MHRYILICCMSISLAFTPFTIAAAAPTENTGFITRNFWYTPEAFYPGDTVRLYAALMNVSGDTITGSVTFYVDNTSVGMRPFAMRESDTVLSVWYDWKATEGAHTFNAKITDSTQSADTSTGTSTMLSVSASVQTVTKERTVATDTETSSTTAETDTSTTTQSVEHYTAKVGESIDSVADTLRAKLENARNNIDSKLAQATSSQNSAIPRVLGDASSTELFQQVVTGETSDKTPTTWHLRATRTILSGAIGLLSHPLGVSFVILLSVFILVKLVQLIWRKATFRP